CTVTASGGSVTFANGLSVNPKKPIAKFGNEPSKNDPSTIHFDGSDSVAQGGKIVSYNWVFGDGKKDSGKIVNHKYAKADAFNVTLTVENKYHQTDFLTRKIHVVDDGGRGGGGCKDPSPEPLAPESGCSGYGNTQNFTIKSVSDGGKIIVSDRDVHLCG